MGGETISRNIRRTIEQDINELRPEVVVNKLPSHVWRLRNDYEAIKQFEKSQQKETYEETPHRQTMRDLARRLADEISLPW